MAIIGTLTTTNNRDGRFVSAVQSATLDGAGENTASMYSEGFKNLLWTYKANTTTDTNTITAILWVSIDGGGTYFNADSNTDDLDDAGTVRQLTYEGYHTHSYVELDAIGGGSPTMTNIAGCAYNSFI